MTFLIHVRKTDQFSGSFQEHLYAGGVVITGSWLPYSFLKKQGGYFHFVDNVSETGITLKNIIENLENEKQMSKCNRAIISNLSSWPALIPMHSNLYEELN